MYIWAESRPLFSTVPVPCQYRYRAVWHGTVHVPAAGDRIYAKIADQLGVRYEAVLRAPHNEHRVGSFSPSHSGRAKSNFFGFVLVRYHQPRSRFLNPLPKKIALSENGRKFRSEGLRAFFSAELIRAIFFALSSAFLSSAYYTKGEREGLAKSKI